MIGRRAWHIGKQRLDSLTQLAQRRTRQHAEFHVRREVESVVKLKQRRANVDAFAARRRLERRSIASAEAIEYAVRIGGILHQSVRSPSVAAKILCVLTIDGVELFRRRVCIEQRSNEELRPTTKQFSLKRSVYLFIIWFKDKRDRESRFCFTYISNA